MNRMLAAVSILFALASTTPVIAQGASPPRQARAETISVDGVAVTVERFPASIRRAPAVVLVHGSDGANERYRVAARQLGAAGFQVFLVHYLDMTGDQRARFGTLTGNIPVWTRAVQAAVELAANRPGGAGRPIGIIGVSLGAALAVNVALRIPRVAALVSYFGYVPDGSVGGRMPPTLILHGENDRVVRVETAVAFQKALEAQGVANTLRVYPGEGHGFSPAVQAQSVQEVSRFLRRYLGGRRPD